MPVETAACCFADPALAGVSACVAPIPHVVARFTAIPRFFRMSKKAPICVNAAQVSALPSFHADLLGVSVPLLRVFPRPGTVPSPRGWQDFCVCGHDAMAKHSGLGFSRPIDLAAPPFSPAEIEACSKETPSDGTAMGVSSGGETSVVGSGETGNR